MRHAKDRPAGMSGACRVRGLHQLTRMFLMLGMAALFTTQATAASEFVGGDICVECHKDVSDSFWTTTHGRKVNPRSPAARQSCEHCHGPASSHLDADTKEAARAAIKSYGRKGSVPVAKQSDTCMECHQRGREYWDASTHKGKGLSCTSCHEIHGGNDANLAKANATDLCITCHLDIKADLQKFSHHPIREGKVGCTDCHNPHGTSSDKNIKANILNETCYECHAEKRGPFLWEHAPVQENCTTCHSPHGSNYDKLLVAKRPFLCQRCHSNSRHPGTLYALNPATNENPIYTVGSSRVYSRGCQNCHSTIHGSNHPSGKSLLR